MTPKTCINYSHVDIVPQSVWLELDCILVIHFCHRENHFSLRRFNGLSRSLQIFSDANEALLSDQKLKIVINHISTSMTRDNMHRTRRSSMCYKVKNSSLSPTVNEYTHRLRTRKYTTYINNYLDTSGDDDSNHVRPMRELRSNSKSSVSPIKLEVDPDTCESVKTKKSCIKTKRITSDERLVYDNRNYYKVEVMTNKLRSSGVIHRERDKITSRKTKSSSSLLDISDRKKDLTEKFKKKRNSQLWKLNNEAENFIFPRKHELSSENESDEEVNTKKLQSINTNNSRNSKVIKTEPDEETSMDSNSSETSTRKKRRLTQAEAFILDNQRYYKFETPGSRLRYQGSYLSPIAAKNNGEHSTKHAKPKDITKKSSASKVKLEELNFSFEMVPKSEPWYETFQRQDNGDECYSCYNYFSGYHKPFLLPYEIGPLPALNPAVCYQTYKQVKEQVLSDKERSAGCSTPDSNGVERSSSVDNTPNAGDQTKHSEDAVMETEGAKIVHKPKFLAKQGNSRKRLFINSKNPRKSPRQHASTLAILSSLIHQRKRREIHKSRKRNLKQNNSKKKLATIVEERPVEEPEEDYNLIAKNISDMLSNTTEVMSKWEISPSDEENVDVHYKPDAIATLEEYWINSTLDNEKRPNSKKIQSARKPYRKKKTNRTGWPKTNKKPAFRKDGSDSRDGLCGSEHSNNSIMDSPKPDLDSEELDDNSSDNNSNKKSKSHNLSNLSTYIHNSISSDSTKSEGQSANNNKINGDVHLNKVNGDSDNFELSFKNIGMPKRKEHRESSSDNCAEVVIASVGDKIDCVNVDLAKWENAERVLSAKLRSESINHDLFQPYVRVQKLDDEVDVKKKRLSPIASRTRPRRMPASPKSPRMLRRPRGGWTREKYY